MDRNCSPNISSTSFTACARPPHCRYHRWTIWPRCANAPRPTWTVATCPFASALCEAFSVFSRVASKRTPRLADSARKRCWCETSLCSMSPETELLTRGWTMFASPMKLWCFHILFFFFVLIDQKMSAMNTQNWCGRLPSIWLRTHPSFVRTVRCWPMQWFRPTTFWNLRLICRYICV